MEKVSVILGAIGIVIAGLFFGVVLAIFFAKKFPAFWEGSPFNKACCGNCRFRHPMTKEDLEHFPCKSEHRCSIDGSLIPSMDRWCPAYEKEANHEQEKI